MNKFIIEVDMLKGHKIFPFLVFDGDVPKHPWRQGRLSGRKGITILATQNAIKTMYMSVHVDMGR